MTHARAKLIHLLRAVLPFPFIIGLLLVDYLDGLIIIIILSLRSYLSRGAQGGRLLHHADLLLNLCTILSILIFESWLILHVSLFVLGISECLLHLLLLLTANTSCVRPLAFVGRLGHGNLLPVLKCLQISLLLAAGVQVGLLVFVE